MFQKRTLFVSQQCQNQLSSAYCFAVHHHSVKSAAIFKRKLLSIIRQDLSLAFMTQKVFPISLSSGLVLAN